MSISQRRHQSIASGTTSLTRQTPSLSLTVCTTLITLSLLSPSTGVFASPAGSPLPSPIPSPSPSFLSSAARSPLTGTQDDIPTWSGPGYESASRSRSQSVWQRSSSSAGSGTNDLDLSTSSYTSHPDLNLATDSTRAKREEAPPGLHGLGLGLEVDIGPSTTLISDRTARTTVRFGDGSDGLNLINRRRNSADEHELGAGKISEPSEDDVIADSASSGSSKGSTESIERSSSWFSVLRKCFTRSPTGSTHASVGRLSSATTAGNDNNRPTSHDPTRADRWASGKTRRRRAGDEQDIAGLGKSRGRRVGRGMAGQDGDGNTGQGQQATPAANTTTEYNSTTTNYVSDPLPPAPTSALPLNTSFPLPLDSTLSYSLGNSCVAFLTEFLTSDEMAGKDRNEEGLCKPFGLLHGSSSGWADMLRSPDELNPALSQICHPASTAQADECSAFFQRSYKDMIKAGNCRQELQQGNTVALSVYRGLQYYDMMQRAACLQDEATGAYCYLEAMSADRPDDAYLWSIPGGNTLPSTAQPTCSSCSKSLLDLYASSPAVKPSPEISKSAYGPSFTDTIADVLLLITDRCGAGFLNVQMASAATSGAVGRTGAGPISLALGMILSVMTAVAIAL